MYIQLHLFHEIEKERDRVKQLIDHMEMRQRALPLGTLTYKKGYYYRACNYRGKRDEIIISQDLPQSEQLISQLREGRYIAKGLPVLKRNFSCYNYALKQLQPYDPVAIRNELPAQYHQFDLAEILLKGDVDPVDWGKKHYEKNTAFPDHLKYKSEGGLFTRSKAEASIATKLEQNGLVFQYEPMLYLGNQCVSPDFCVLHPIHRKRIYWEHFGGMDIPEYVSATMDKLQLYTDYGYKLGDNLIMTWETKDCPLNFEHINDRIKIHLS